MGVLLSSAIEEYFFIPQRTFQCLVLKRSTYFLVVDNKSKELFSTKEPCVMESFHEY